MPTKIINGIAIEYEVDGPENGPPALLIMGLAQQLTFWPDDFVAALNAGGYRTIRFDNRDVGKSQRFEGKRAPNPVMQAALRLAGVGGLSPYSLEDMAGDAVGLLDALGVAKAHVVGVSMGGMIAQTLAATHPARVETLTIIMSSTNNPALPRARDDVAKALMTPPVKGATKEDVIDRSVAFWRMISTQEGGPTEAELRARIAAAYDRGHNPAGIRRQLAAIIDAGDLRRYARRIAAPTLVMHGSADPLVPPTGGADVAKNVNGAVFELIDGMGHDIPKKFRGRIAERMIGHFRKGELSAG